MANKWTCRLQGASFPFWRCISYPSPLTLPLNRLLPAEQASCFVAVSEVLQAAPLANQPAWQPSPAAEMPAERSCKLFQLIQAEQLQAADTDCRSWYFRRWDRELLAANREHPMQLCLHPGAFLAVTYRNSLAEPAASQFRGVLTQVRDAGTESRFWLTGLLDGGVSVRMAFATYSPLICRIEVLRRAVYNSGMDYIRHRRGISPGGLASIKHLCYAASELARRPEVIDRQVVASLQQRLAAKLPEQIPKGWQPIQDYDDADRYYDKYLC